MSLVRIKPLIVGGREILPAFSLDREVSRYGSSAQNVYKIAPTLAQLRHAYENSRIKTNILANRYRDEWTATFLRDGKEAVERPDEVVYENGLWVAKGGVVKTFEHFPEGKLPGDGWALEYDKLTGFPSRTGLRREAEKVFRNDASYFYANKNGLRAVRRNFGGFDDVSSPFGVRAGWQPDFGGSDIGCRSVVQ